MATSTPKTGIQSIDAAERQRTALELRKAGASYDQIADKLDVSKSMAAKVVRTALKSIIKEPAEEVRDMEVARLDAALFAIWSQVKQGNHGAIDRFIKIQDRRAAYLGLDAPKESALNVSGTLKREYVLVRPDSDS